MSQQQKFFIAFAISISFLFAGFALLHYHLIGYGYSFFVFLPFTLGYIFGGKLAKKISLFAIITALIIFFALLLFSKVEGMICVLMALPIVFIMIGIGFLIKWIIEGVQRKSKGSDENITKNSFTLFSLFLLLAFGEQKLSEGHKEVVSVKTEITLPYSCMEVYEAIKSVDTLIAKKTFLMELNLPVPHKCVLEKEIIGGIRTCYFDGGTITERITELEKGKIMRMDVIDYKLTGRKWLGFKEAIYYFEVIDSTHSKLIRETTYTSQLKPRIYWEPLEKMGIEQEHDYVFENLQRDLINKYGKR
jgi:hypothetical protein